MLPAKKKWQIELVSVICEVSISLQLKVYQALCRELNQPRIESELGQWLRSRLEYLKQITGGIYGL